MRPVRLLLALDTRFGFDREVTISLCAGAQAYGNLWFHHKRLTHTLAEALGHVRATGIVVSTSDPRAIDEAVATGLPCVNVANFLAAHGRVPVVGTDDAAIGRAAAAYFLDRGYRAFAFFGDVASSYFDARRDGFVTALREAGFDCAVGPPPPPADAPQQAQEVAARWLADLPKPLAVLGGYDMFANATVNACHLADLKVPEAVAVLGVDNDPLLCMTVWPNLSSVVTPVAEIGRAALRLLLSLIGGGPPPAAPVLLPPVGVAARGSTSDRAIDDADVAEAVNFIRNHLRGRLTIATVAERLALSRRTLERKFAHHLGRSPLDEIRMARLGHAKRLLAETDLPLAEVARLSGLIHVQRLSLLVREDTGLTPRQFRARAGGTT